MAMAPKALRVTLERAAGARARALEAAVLRAAGPSRFHALVVPALPRPGLRGLGPSPPPGPGPAPGADAWPPGARRVQTVAAQAALPRQLPAALRRAATAGAESGAAAEAAAAPAALLCVSGSHGARRLPGAGRVLGTSFDLLRAGAEQRAAGAWGEGGGGVELWAVENPLAAPTAERLERKLAAGAQAVITQPPLLPGRFARWWADAERRGLAEAAPLLVGLPMITSARNFRFWLGLTDAADAEAEAAELLGELEAAAAEGEAALRARCREHTLQTLAEVRRLPGLGGLHIMPVTPRGYEDLAWLLAEGHL